MEVTDTVEVVIDVFVSEPDVTMTGQVVTVTYVMTVWTVGGTVFSTGVDPEDPPFDLGPPGAGVADVSLSGGGLDAPVAEEAASDDGVELPTLEEEDEEPCGQDRS